MTGIDGKARESPTRDWGTRVRSYFTLTKPGITAFILLVAVAGYFVASPYPPDWARLGELLVAGGLASGGAAALNHWYDRDLDAAMRRTRARPIPTERIPAERVRDFGLGLSAAGWILAAALLGLGPFLAIASGTLVYVGIYTMWLKRRTRWNIVIGGYAGSAPVLAGSLAAVGMITPAAALLALLIFLWTPPHFWSLALVLKDDFGQARLPMLPNPQSPQRSGQTVVLSAALLLPVTLAFYAFRANYLPFFVLATALGIAFVGITSLLWVSPERRTALWGFIFSGVYLLGIVGAVLVNWLWIFTPLVPH
jgi:protoheme IX farnesyltransferase